LYDNVCKDFFCLCIKYAHGIIVASESDAEEIKDTYNGLKLRRTNAITTSAGRQPNTPVTPPVAKLTVKLPCILYRTI